MKKVEKMYLRINKYYQILDYKPATSKKYKRIETKLQTGTTVKDIEYKS